MARKKHHEAHHEEHIDETWLVPYADILTLLLALFIVLFAAAQVGRVERISVQMPFAAFALKESPLSG